MPYICQDHLPFSPWMSPFTRRLPGVQPIRSNGCFLKDEVFQYQMKYRDYLLRSKRDEVYFDDYETDEACDEVLEFVIQELKKNNQYIFKDQTVIRPDGVEVELSVENALITAGRLVQEDLLLLRREGSQHFLRAGVLCFPASWTLSEKRNKSLTSIHNPVEEYGFDIAQKIEKMFCHLKPEMPVWRANFLLYDDYELFQPRLEKDEKGNSHKKLSQYMRVERQTLKKLPKSKSILFSIHTFVVPYKNLSNDQRRTLAEILV